MATILLVAGPPFGPPLWDQVARRLRHHGHRVHTHALVGPEAGPGLDGRVAGLSAAAAALDAPVLVAHGLAVPVALRLGPAAGLAGLVLSNGPVDAVDPVVRGLARLCRSPGLAARSWLHPVLFQRWLWSSAGLRRAVVNPYVMGRDTVVAVTGAALVSAAARADMARFMVDLVEYGPWPGTAPAAAGRRLLVWGDDDRLYPAAVADRARVKLEDADFVRVPGGRHLHPVERPWELADAVHGWLGGATGVAD